MLEYFDQALAHILTGRRSFILSPIVSANKDDAFLPPLWKEGLPRSKGFEPPPSNKQKMQATEQNAHGGRRTRAQARVEEKEEVTAPQQVVQPARRVTRSSVIQATAQTMLEEHDADDEEALKGSKDNPNGSFLQHEDEEESSDEEIGDVDDQDGQDADDQSSEGIGQMVDDDDQSDDGMGFLQCP